MTLSRGSLRTLVLSALAIGCGAGLSVPVAVAKAPEPQILAQTAPASKPVAPAAPKAPEPAAQSVPPMTYDAKGRRDPFAPIQLAKEKITGLDVGTVKLVGVISGSHLLALVEAPDGLGYIVKAGDVLGNGRVTEVAPTSITFAVSSGSDKDKKETSLTLKLVRE